MEKTDQKKKDVDAVGQLRTHAMMGLLLHLTPHTSRGSKMAHLARNLLGSSLRKTTVAMGARAFSWGAGVLRGPAIKLMKAIKVVLNVNTGAPATERPFQTLSEYL